jgi:hypothetical protein
MSSRDLIASLLPVFWIVVSVITALLLYRTSSGSLSSIAGIPVRKLSLTGSVVIAVVVFLLLQQATSKSAVMVSPPDTIQIARAELDSLKGTSIELENELRDLNECVQIAGAFTDCSDRLQRARRSANSLRIEVEVANKKLD